MRKKILKKNFFLKKLKCFFLIVCKLLTVLMFIYFQESSWNIDKMRKVFWSGKTFFCSKIYFFFLTITMRLTSFLPFLLSNCMFWPLLAVIIFGLSSWNVHKMRKNIWKTKIAKEFLWTFLSSFSLTLHFFHILTANKFLIRSLGGFENNRRRRWQKNCLFSKNWNRTRYLFAFFCQFACFWWFWCW